VISINLLVLTVLPKKLKLLRRLEGGPCGVCSKCCGSYSVECTWCIQWAHKKLVVLTAVCTMPATCCCSGCTNPIVGDWRSSANICNGSRQSSVISTPLYVDEMRIIRQKTVGGDMSSLFLVSAHLGCPGNRL